MAISDIMGLLGRAGESIGGGTSGIYTGLLSEDELRAAKNRASTKALFDLSAAMAEAGRPQAGRPTSTFGALAKGLSAAQEGYQGTLQQQAKEKLAAQEMQRKLQSQQRTAEAQRLAQGIFTPATPAQPAAMIGGAPYGMDKPAQPGGFNQEAIQQLMAFPEGQAALQSIMEARKAMQPEMFSLKEGDIQYSRDPFSGAVTQVATGTPKVVKPELESSFAAAVDRLGFPRKNASEYTPTELAMINAKAQQIDKAKKSETTIKPPSDAQVLAGGFADRMVAAQSLTSALESKAPVGVMESIYNSIPLIGDKIPQVLPQSFGGLSPERRQYLQAANNWIRANLRKESGAAIGADEWTQEYVNYFPQPGDDQATIDQKAMFREVTTQNMARAAGRDYKPLVPESIDKKTKDMYAKYGLTPRSGN